MEQLYLPRGLGGMDQTYNSNREFFFLNLDSSRIERETKCPIIKYLDLEPYASSDNKYADSCCSTSNAKLSSPTNVFTSLN